MFGGKKIECPDCKITYTVAAFANHTCKKPNQSVVSGYDNRRPIMASPVTDPNDYRQRPNRPSLEPGGMVYKEAQKLDAIAALIKSLSYDEMMEWQADWDRLNQEDSFAPKINKWAGDRINNKLEGAILGANNGARPVRNDQRAIGHSEVHPRDLDADSGHPNYSPGLGQ